MARLRRNDTVGAMLAALPPELRTFSPLSWLRYGESPDNPVHVHGHAWARWQDAIAAELGIRDLVDAPDVGQWWGPLPGRDDCPCFVCSGQ